MATIAQKRAETNLRTPESTLTDLTYSEFIWWWLHHSGDPDRLAAMYGSYYDESSIDGDGPVSAIGGLILDHEGFASLEIEWLRLLDKYPQLPKNSDKRPYIHMKDFGKGKPLYDFPVPDRYKLFSGLAGVINRYKNCSIGATLMNEEYRYTAATFRKSPGLSFHAVCFLMAAYKQFECARDLKSEHKIPYVLDCGCNARSEIDAAHRLMTGSNPQYKPWRDLHVGGLSWLDDKDHPQLQAADVVAWVVRKERAPEQLANGFEPLGEILDKHHNRAHFEDDWLMQSTESSTE